MVESFKRGVELYRGEFCSGESAEWMHPLRVRTADAYCTMLEALAQEAWRTHDYHRVAEYSLRIIEAKPAHEGAARLAMRAFAALGRLATARQVYEALCHRLRSHLDVAPGRDTDELLARILRGTNDAG